MEPTTTSGDEKEAQELAKKYKKEEGNELITHGQSDKEEGVHRTQYDSDDPLNDDNMGVENLMNCKSNNTRKRSWQEEELICKLEDALCYRKWDLAECLVIGSSVHVLNEALCLSLGSIWFLSTHEELNELTTLIKKIVLSGASDFRGAAIRSSFFASFVSAWQSETMSLGKLETFVDQRLHISREECNANEVISKEAVDCLLKFADWATVWIKEHQGSSDSPKMFTLSEIQLQLTTFRTFLDLAENRLTICDFAEALHGACKSFIIYSCSLSQGWVSGTSAAVLRGLLNILVERGADNVNQCILEASRFDCAEVVRMLLQIARSNSLAVDVDEALDIAATNSRLDTMNVLVDEGQATYFSLPFVKAVMRSRTSVVSWFINRGCSNDHLCVALAYAASSNQHEAATCLLSKIPLEVLAHFKLQILTIAAKAGHGSFDGVAFLLSSNFLGSYDATYEIIEGLINEEDESMPELAAYLENNWSESSFHEGVGVADDHYVNVMRVLRRGCSGVQLRELPAGTVMAIALMPMYRECLKVKGELLPHRLKGELVWSLRRLGCLEAEAASAKGELMTMLERLLPSFAVLK